MIKLFIVFFSLFFPFTAYGDLPAGYFSNLESVRIKNAQSYLAYFHYNPGSTVILNELNRDLSGEYGFAVTDVARITVKVDAEETYLITYDEGLPAGPNFTFYKLDGPDMQSVGSINGINLYWPRARNFYTSGVLHSMYDQRRKYVLLNGKIREVQQPFMYVGKESELSENIIIYSSQALQDEVGYLPAGAKVSVLLADNDFYLIKTSFGLVGWMKIEKESKK
ncbi:MAG: hypothetical protein M8357_04700 [Desulfobulbaceae bacterium]|nr:hypothetical protein [Desulfobulbaceae bacterium]